MNSSEKMSIRIELDEASALRMLKVAYEFFEKKYDTGHPNAWQERQARLGMITAIHWWECILEDKTEEEKKESETKKGE